MLSTKGIHMAKILNIDDMLEAAENSEMPYLRMHVNQVEEAANSLARALAAHLNINVGTADWQGEAFGGTCAPFYPKFDGQPCPEEIDRGDEGGDWVPLGVL